LHLAANCIRAGRANRMLVVAVEVDNEVTRALSPAGRAWFNGAVAVVLEHGDHATARGAHLRGRLGEYRFASQGTSRAGVGHGDAPDVTRNVGDAYGAEGLVQLLAASQRVARSAQRTVLVCGHKFGDAVAVTQEVELYA
jgi:3-oxoacyl-[acyl-carrier-protein] synthase II